ncbi:hypothetical protein HMPREF1545_02926 [Oscillibacter sp. KLE 1728]|nr:hypothetical protein HMPREF1545_02926 [Oscillibacter sp. KLE 1728]ERK66454.1 hypothetical protein HMPREF1546_00793 [Oscillibacter sp. KLE 1745]
MNPGSIQTLSFRRRRRPFFVSYQIRRKNATVLPVRQRRCQRQVYLMMRCRRIPLLGIEERSISVL